MSRRGLRDVSVLVCFRGGLVLFAAIVMSSAWLAAGQPPAAPARTVNQSPEEPEQIQPPIFRTGVSLVRVDVSVFDRRDRPIEDLTAADFEIREDGIPQVVETAQFLRLSGDIPPGQEESIDIRSASHARVEAGREDVRLFVVFLDDYHVDKHPRVTLPLRRALTEFVKQFGPMDLVAIMDPLTPLSHLEFTRSREDLLERVRKFEGRRGELFPVRSAAEEAQLQSRYPLLLRAGVTLSALEAIVTHLGGLREGRKSVLFVSQGPPVGMPGVGSMDPAGNEVRLTDVVRAANRANVTIHALDPRPLGSAPFGGTYSLRRLTDETGGRAIVNTNDPREALAMVIADASAYYLVGYTPRRDPADGKFHKIDVRVKRPGVRVLARQGYWAPSENELNPVMKPAPNPEVVEALSDLTVPADGRALEVWVGASRGPNGRTRLTVTWEATGRHGTTAPTRVHVELVDAEAAASLAPAQTIVTGFDAGAEGVATFDLEPGPATLRLTASASDNTVIDSWSERVQVPDMSGELTLATPRFLRARSAYERRQLEVAETPVPAASRRLRKTEQVLVEIEAHSSGNREVALTVDLLNQGGDVLLSLPVPPLKNDRARITIPVYSIANGTYLLRVQADDGAQQSRQLSAFQVVP